MKTKVLNRCLNYPAESPWDLSRANDSMRPRRQLTARWVKAKNGQLICEWQVDEQRSCLLMTQA
ncbi:MAG: hypothetical protein ACFB0G_20145 [Leptolyngbyaceae cyanobacterium]